jgi:Domain of unknown function (DUF4268)
MTSSAPQLGMLQRVDPREVWPTEAGHFTPWLAQADQLRLLGDTIGFDLTLEAQEKSVGPFRADILCKETTTDHWVLIENQLEKTDHTHLGQLITYAAGLGAVTIVWVANPFTDEHRAALDWLNDITDSHFNFFGLEIELWRIGDSALAPKFNVVCQPNDWRRTVAQGASHVESGTLTESRQLQVRFWTGFRTYVGEHDTPIRATKPLPQNWMNIAIGRSGCRLAAVASLWDSEAETFDRHELRAEVVLDGGHAKSYFAQLECDKTTIESDLGYALFWHNPSAARSCRLFVRQSVDLRDEGQWLAHYQWLLEHLEGLHRVFHRRVQTLGRAGNKGVPPLPSV